MTNRIIQFLNQNQFGLDVSGSASDLDMPLSLFLAEKFDSIHEGSWDFPDCPNDFPLVLVPSASFNIALVSVDLMPSEEGLGFGGVFGADTHTMHLASGEEEALGERDMTRILTVLWRTVIGDRDILVGCDGDSLLWKHIHGKLR